MKDTVRLTGSKLLQPQVSVKYNLTGAKGKEAFNTFYRVKDTMLGKEVYIIIVKLVSPLLPEAPRFSSAGAAADVSHSPADL